MSSALGLYTLFHVLLSLAGIVAGGVVAGGFISGKRLDGWTGVFLAATVATNLTGFGFPFGKVLPSHVGAVLSLAVLSGVIVARYLTHLAGTWRGIYGTGSVLAPSLKVFGLLGQLFHSLTP